MMDVQDLDEKVMAEAIGFALLDAGLQYIEHGRHGTTLDGTVDMAAVARHLKRRLLAEPLDEEPPADEQGAVS